MVNLVATALGADSTVAEVTVMLFAAQDTETSAEGGRADRAVLIQLMRCTIGRQVLLTDFKEKTLSASHSRQLFFHIVASLKGKEQEDTAYYC